MSSPLSLLPASAAQPAMLHSAPETSAASFASSNVWWSFAYPQEMLALAFGQALPPQVPDRGEMSLDHRLRRSLWFSRLVGAVAWPAVECHCAWGSIKATSNSNLPVGHFVEPPQGGRLGEVAGGFATMPTGSADVFQRLGSLDALAALVALALSFSLVGFSN
jgi:hypothetical protein